MNILEEMGEDNNISSPFSEHNFINSSLKIGLSYQDLKELTYIDVMKIMLSNVEGIKSNKPNQANINQLLG